MVNRKDKVPRDAASPARARSSAPPRTASYTRLLRVDEEAAGAGAPSTLPPPPFARETSVVGLEWWLDAHMGLASGLLWVGQLLDTVPEGDAHGETVRRLAAHTEAVRDALYELYCDAADDRAAPLVGRGTPLEQHVRGSYGWCVRVVGLLATVTNGLRAESRPDWIIAKGEFRAATNHYPVVPAELREAIRALPIDFTSPIEPLRNLPNDLDQLIAATQELQAMLGKRFA
jgi:hypothetical protein